MDHFHRILKAPQQSFFLLGPRATGKSTWLKINFKEALHFDLLRQDTFFALTSSTTAFREAVLAKKAADTWIIIDEVQKIPHLLDEVHSLIESHGYRFALSGSSARKLKRGQSNLLAGRALIKHMFPLTFKEFGDALSLQDALRYGTLPSVANNQETKIEQLEAYVGTYLTEEIKAEALTRNVPGFSRFLEVAGLMQGQVTNLANISRDAHIPRTTVTTYFDILIDTLIGCWLPAFKPKAKVKEQAHPKFYFFDCGVVRAIQKLLRDEPSSIEYGILFETFILNELRAYISYASTGGELFYWRTQDGIEIDLIYKRGNKIIAIEIKSNTQWKNTYHTGFLSLLNSKIELSACYGIYCGSDVLKKDWGWVLPWQEFLQRLYSREIFS